MKNRLQDIHQSIKEFSNQLSPNTLKIAYKANLSNYEMKICHEISELKQLQLDDVFHKMGYFKESIDHRLYKKDFIDFI